MKTLSLRVLVVDDDQPYSILLKKSLSGHGHSVIVCNSAADAFHCLPKEHFGIVLVDYNMGCSSGINILQGMHDKKMDIPVILITGYGSEELYDETYQWGASEYFVTWEMDDIRIPAMVEQVFASIKRGKQSWNRNKNLEDSCWTVVHDEQKDIPLIAN